MKFFYSLNKVDIASINNSPEEQILYDSNPDALKTHKFNDDHLYISTGSHAARIRQQLMSKNKKTPIKILTDHSSQKIEYTQDFPYNLFQLEHKGILLPDRINQLKNGTSIKIAIINGMGTGLGDSIVGLTAYRAFYKELSKYYKTVHVDFLQTKKSKNIDIYKNESYINELIQLPVSLKDFKPYDAYIDLDGMIVNEDFNNRPMLDFYLMALGIDPKSLSSEEKRNQVHIDENIKYDIDRILNPLKTKSKLLLFHPTASNGIRSIPINQQQRIIDEILNITDVQIITAIDVKVSHPRLINLSHYSKSIKHLIAIISCMDYVFTVDTVTYHIADSLNIPSLVVFTTIDPKYRTSYYPHVSSIQLIANTGTVSGIHKTNSMVQQIIVSNQWSRFKTKKALKKLRTLNQIDTNNRSTLDKIEEYLNKQNAFKFKGNNLVGNKAPILISIPVYNRVNILKKTIESLSKTNLPENTTIVFHDDCSDDITVSKIIHSIKWANTTHIRKNKQVRQNLNTLNGIDYCFQNYDVPFVINIDSDTIFNKEWLNKLIDIYQRFHNDTIAAISAFNVHDHVWHKVIKDIDDTCCQKSSLGGFGLLIPRKFWDIYGEEIRKIIVNNPRFCWDLQLSKIAKKNGYKLLSLNDSYIQHIGIFEGLHTKNGLGDTAKNFIGE